MRRRIILKLFRLYLIIDKKSEKFTLIHYLIIVAISATVTASVKRIVTVSFSDREPAGDIIYDYVEPQVPQLIHEHMRNMRTRNSLGD